jgi:hypothetical protein
MCKERQENDNISVLRSWPEERHIDRNWLSLAIDRWTFRYMNELLDRVKIRDTNEVQHLTHDDLFPVPSAMRAEFLSQQFRSLYHQHRDKKESQLITALWKMAAPTFIPAGVCQLITVACQVALPLLVRELLQVLEENPKQQVISEGLPYALALFFTSVLNAFGNHRHRHLAMKSGIVMRAALINVLYQHVLQLTPKGRAGLTSGEVTNLLAVDTQKLYEVAQEGHLVWSLPLTVILVTYFLVRTLGWSALVGVATLILFVPIVERVTAAMMSIRSERVKYTDRRIEISTAMLQGVSQKTRFVSKRHATNGTHKGFTLDQSDKVEQLRRKLSGTNRKSKRRGIGRIAQGNGGLGNDVNDDGRFSRFGDSCRVHYVRTGGRGSYSHRSKGIRCAFIVCCSTISNQLRWSLDRQ